MSDLRSALQHGRIEAKFTMMDVVGHIIIWMIISTVTLGIGLFFWPYAAIKLVLNNIQILDNSGATIGKLRCELSAGQQIGHIIIWTLLSLVTLGIAFPFYTYGVARTAINKTEIV